MVASQKIEKNIVAILGRDKSQVASVEVYYKNAEFEDIHCFYEPAQLIQFAANRQDDISAIAILKDQDNIGWQPVSKAIRSQVKTPVVLFIDMNDNLTENEQRFLSKLPDGSWLRSPLKNRSHFINGGTQAPKENSDELIEKLNEVKSLYKKNLSHSAKTIHGDMLDNYDASKDKAGFMERVESGILEIEKILNSDLSGFNHNFELMEFYIDSGEIEKFDKLFEHLFDLYSKADDSFWLGQLGELCLSLKLDVYVERIVQFMLGSANNDFKWRAILLQARWHIMSSNLVAANDCIADAAHFAGEGKAEIFNLLGIVKRREGNVEDALTCFENAVKLSCTDHRLYFNIALCYNSLNRTDEAIDRLRKALNIFPKYIRAKNLLVRISQQ